MKAFAKKDFLRVTGTKVYQLAMSNLDDAQFLNGTEEADKRINFSKFLLMKFASDMTVTVDAEKLANYFLETFNYNK